MLLQNNARNVVHCKEMDVAEESLSRGKEACTYDVPGGGEQKSDESTNKLSEFDSDRRGGEGRHSKNLKIVRMSYVHAPKRQVQV